MDVAAAMFAGTVAGSLYDPLVWAFIAGGLALGGARLPWPWAAALAIVALVARMMISSSNRELLGLPPNSIFPLLSGLAGAFLVLLPYGIARGIRALLPRPLPKQADPGL